MSSASISLDDCVALHTNNINTASHIRPCALVDPGGLRTAAEVLNAAANAGVREGVWGPQASLAEA
jgi:hypothetical protein